MSATYWILFGVAVCVCLPILLFYAKRNPNPFFRPRPGEILLVAIIMLCASAGIAYLLQGVFRADDLSRRSDAPFESSPRSREGDSE